MKHQCDASLLIKRMPSGAKTELDAGSNEGIRGLDFIDYLKSKVLASCGGANLVSCADIIALAARDAVAIVSLSNSHSSFLFNKNLRDCQ